MEKWPLGVFTSIDAGLGVKLEVAHELGVPTIQLHAPAAGSRTPENAERFLQRLRDLGITLTAVFGGFEGESYADIPTVVRTVGLVPPETRVSRTREMKEIADFARILGCNVVALHLGFIPHDPEDPRYTGDREGHTRGLRSRSAKTARICIWRRDKRGPKACSSSSTTCSGTICSSTSTRPT